MVDDCNTTIMEVFEQTKDVPLSLANPIRIPPRSVVVALVECNRPLHAHMDIKGDAGFLREYPNIHVSCTYVNELPESSNCMPFSFTNFSMHSQYLGKDKVVGFAESTTDEVEVHALADYDEIKEMMRGPFSDLSTAHGFQAKAAQGIAELASLITPEQMTLILAAAVPPTIQIVLPPGSASPLLTPPLPPTTAATKAERQNIIKYCKKNILPDPAANCFAKVDKKAPTRVLAAAIYCTLERKYFDDKTPRAQVAMMFQVTTAQLTKAVTGVDYMSGPHTYIKKRKTSAEPSTSTATQTPKPTAAKTTSATQEAEDTLSSSSSSSDLPPL